jgi:anti-sigma-K factor RskA
MTTGLSREEVRERLAAYALGALDADERAAVEAGLSRFPECQAELAQYGIVVHGLARAVPEHMPPARLKPALLAAAVPPRTRPGWWQRLIETLNTPRLAPKLAVAALILAGVVLITPFVVQVLATRQQLAADQQAQAILAASSESVRLNGTQNAPGAQATIHFRPEERYAALQVSNLPPLPQAQAYQLWLADSRGRRWSGAVFNTNASGESLVLVSCRVPMANIVRFGVSVEPAGGSPAPTGPPMLRNAQS